MRTLLHLPLDQIDRAEADQIVPLDEAGAAALADDMAAPVGQLVPIIVRKAGDRAKVAPYSLVDGLQRLRAAELLGLDTIEAVAVPPLHADEIMRRRVSANLHRRGYNVIQLALLVGARSEIAERDDMRPGETLQQKAAYARHRARETDASANMADASWLDATAAMLGCHRRKVEAYLTIYRGVAKPFRDLLPALLAHSLGDHRSALYKIAREPDERKRRREVERLLSISDDKVRVMPTPHPIEQNRFVHNLWSNWDRLGLHHQNHVIDDFPERATPAQLARLIRRASEKLASTGTPHTPDQDAQS